MGLTRGRGADVVCEAVGKPELVAEAVRLCRFAGVVNLVGVSPRAAFAHAAAGKDVKTIITPTAPGIRPRG